MDNSTDAPRGSTQKLGMKSTPSPVPGQQVAAPLVSILIPAFRATWLNEAIASALAQTFSDFELLISDDSADDRIEQLVGKWSDPRIQYFKNPNRGAPGSNRDHLISRARGEYLKFLFDDDLLYPRSVEILVAMARKTGCQLAFHSRDIIDERGKRIGRERLFIAPDRENRLEFLRYKARRKAAFLDTVKMALLRKPDFAIVAPEYFFNEMLGKISNSIGEPTNLLIHAETLRRLGKPFQVGDHRLRFLTDMALYANFFASGATVAGTSWVGSAFRRHGAQTSTPQYPGYSAGLFEWDLFGRWAFDIGALSHHRFQSQHARVMAIYNQHADIYPELRYFMDLPIGLEDGVLLGQRFDEAQQLAYRAIDERRARLTGGGVC